MTTTGDDGGMGGGTSPDLPKCPACGEPITGMNQLVLCEKCGREACDQCGPRGLCGGCEAIIDGEDD